MPAVRLNDGTGHDRGHAVRIHRLGLGSRSFYLALVVWGLTGPGLVLEAQSVLYSLTSNHAPHAVGWNVAGLGDVNGDGHDDLAIGVPDYGDGADGERGAIEVISGASGMPLFQVAGEGAGDRFGQALAAVADLDGDGVRDLLVGAPGRSDRSTKPGYALLLSGRDGAALRRFGHGPGDGRFGWAVGHAGDVDGDAVADVIVGGILCGPSREGCARVYSGRTGSKILEMIGDRPWDYFGWAVGYAGDMDGDHRDDVFVGAPCFGDLGQRSYARVVSGGTGQKIASLVNPDSSIPTYVGTSACTAGDLDGDGFDELAVGMTSGPYDSGGIMVVSIRNLRWVMYGGMPFFGQCVVNVGDLDGDGHAELLVAGPSPAGRADDQGFAWVLSPHPKRIAQAMYGGSGELRFGWSVSGVGDVNDDGVDDLAVGAPLPDGRSYVRIYSSQPLVLTASTHVVSLRRKEHQFLSIDAGPAWGYQSYHVVGTISGTRPGLRFHGVRLPLNPDPYFWLTVVLPNVYPLKNSAGVLDSDGRALAAFAPTAPVHGFYDTSVVGITLHHACVLNRGASLHATPAVPITVTP